MKLRPRVIFLIGVSALVGGWILKTHYGRPGFSALEAGLRGDASPAIAFDSRGIYWYERDTQRLMTCDLEGRSARVLAKVRGCLNIHPQEEAICCAASGAKPGRISLIAVARDQGSTRLLASGMDSAIVVGSTAGYLFWTERGMRTVRLSEEYRQYLQRQRMPTPSVGTLSGGYAGRSPAPIPETEEMHTRKVFVVPVKGGQPRLLLEVETWQDLACVAHEGRLYWSMQERVLEDGALFPRRETKLVKLSPEGTVTILQSAEQDLTKPAERVTREPLILTPMFVHRGWLYGRSGDQLLRRSLTSARSENVARLLEGPYRNLVDVDRDHYYYVRVVQKEQLSPSGELVMIPTSDRELVRRSFRGDQQVIAGLDRFEWPRLLLPSAVLTLRMYEKEKNPWSLSPEAIRLIPHYQIRLIPR